MRPGTLAAVACWAVAWSWTPAAWAEAPASVRVESGGVACPSAEQVETALRHVGVSAAGATDGWVLSYGDVSAGAAIAQAPFVWMDLASPTGQLVARRQLPD